MSYVGNTPTTQSFIAGTDYFNGTGSATAFTLSRSVVSVNDIQATVNNVVQVPNDAYTVNGTTITFTSAPSAGTNNIYVRYLSTTTQSITPSQNTVSYSTLNSDNQSKLGISFKNRIINGAMVISQRGTGSTTVASSGYYSCDMWNVSISQASKVSIQQNAGSVTPPAGFKNYVGITTVSAYTPSAGDYGTLRTFVEGYNSADLNWGTANAKTITLSFQVYSSLTGTFGGVLQNNAGNRSYPFTYTISAANTWTPISITIVGDTSGTWATDNSRGIEVDFNIASGSSYQGTAGAWAAAGYYSATGATNMVTTASSTFYLTGVQLEVGTQATTFDYRDYGRELLLCQRYYIKLSPIGNTSNNQTYLTGVLTGATTANICSTIFPATMRSAPTSSYNDLRVYDGSAAPAMTSIAVQGSSYTNAALNVIASGGGMTTGRVALVIPNSASSYVDFSAEL
jgi:hypothetical protein